MDLLTLGVVFDFVCTVCQRDRPFIPFDHVIEATVRRQSGARKRQKAQFVMVERDLRVMRDYILSQATDIASSIVNAAVEANNSERWPALVSYMEKDQFGGRPMENHHIYLRNFLAKRDTIKLNGVLADAIRLKVFPFLLTDKASDWFLN